MKIQIVNLYRFHYEIIESVIVKYKQLINIDFNSSIEIHLNIKENKSFQDYILEKYDYVKLGIIEDYEYYINCTIYDKDFDYIDKKDSKKKYIAHEITDRLKKNPNVYFLTPLANKFFYADILPLSQLKKKVEFPIFIVQGNLNQNRRHLPLLIKILDKEYKYKFKVKIIGRGVLPDSLIKYSDKIILKNYLNFLDFHKEFLDGYCILPLITKKTKPKYYSKKLTSTINYARGYKLKCLIDKDLQDIYNLDDVELFNNIDDITLAFEKTLNQFYENRI